MMENLPELVGIVVSILGVIGGVFKFVQDKITVNENRLDELEDMQKELDKKSVSSNMMLKISKRSWIALRLKLTTF